MTVCVPRCSPFPLRVSQYRHHDCKHLQPSQNRTNDDEILIPLFLYFLLILNNSMLGSTPGCQLFLGEGIKCNPRFFVSFRESVDRSELAAYCSSDHLKGLMARLVSCDTAVDGRGGTPLFLLNGQLVFELLECSLIFLDLLQYSLDDRVPANHFPKPVSPSIEPLPGKGVRVSITLQVSIEVINLLLLSGNGCREICSRVPGKGRIIVLLRLSRFVPGFDLFSDLQLDRDEEDSR